jgi:hypothetical protein
MKNINDELGYPMMRKPEPNRPCGLRAKKKPLMAQGLQKVLVGFD